MTPLLLDQVRTLPTVEKRTIIHVEDEEVYEVALRHAFRLREVGYLRISLVSEAAGLIRNKLVEGFIIDLRLPTERTSEFQGWGDFPRDSLGLIEKIRRDRKDIPVVVLTNFYEDPDLESLIRRGLLSRDDVFRKMDLTDDTVIDNLVARLRAREEIPTDLDPDLQYLVVAAQRGYQPRATSSTREGEVAVLARVNNLQAWQRLEGVRPGGAIASSGEEWIVTGKVRIDRVVAVHRQPFVLSLEAARRLQPVQETRGPGQAGFLPPRQTGGRGVVVGIIDYGCDFAHSRFRNADGSTRLLAFWDQTRRHADSEHLEAKYEADRINAALQAKDPYEDLKHHPGPMAHGTHVMDIAAGQGDQDWNPGLASEADLIFVNLSGNSSDFVEALSFVFRTAGDRPCVINASVGLNSGPHDGSMEEEKWIDALVNAAPNRAVVISAGNDCHKGLHTRGTVSRRDHADLRWSVESPNGKRFKLEIWYSGRDVFSAELFRPSGERLCRVPLDSKEEDRNGVGLPGFVLAHQHKSNGDNLVALHLGPNAEPGQWRLRLAGERVSDGSFHAWIESVESRPASFVSPDVTSTLNALACGDETVVVGSCEGRPEDCSCSHFSGSGPTRDGRKKPDLCAPGERIMAAGSCSLDPVEMTGTSMAAPVVTGYIALLLSDAHAQGRSLTTGEIREILLHSIANKEPHAIWTGCLGWGCLHREDVS